jgi:CobB/CobQ-like glutamine amidotransferase domain
MSCMCRCELVHLSLATATRLPHGIAAIFICGEASCSELAALSANTGIRRAVAAFCAAGGVAYAEGAGLAYLSTTVRAEGEQYSMAGVLPTHIVVRDEVQVEGYVAVTTRAGCALFEAGQQLRGSVRTTLDVRQEVPAVALQQRHRARASGGGGEMRWAFDAQVVDVAEGAAGSSAQPGARATQRQRSLRGASAGPAGDDDAVCEGYCVKRALGTVINLSFASNRDAVAPLVAACRAVDTEAVAAAALNAGTPPATRARSGSPLAHVRVQVHRSSGSPGRREADTDHSPLWDTGTAFFSAPRTSSGNSALAASSPYSWNTALSSALDWTSRGQPRHRREGSSDVASGSLGPVHLVSAGSSVPANSMHPAGSVLPSSMSADVNVGRRSEQLLRRSHSVSSRLAARPRMPGLPLQARGGRRSSIWPPRVHGHVRVFSSHDLEAFEANRTGGSEHTGAHARCICFRGSCSYWDQ